MISCAHADPHSLGCPFSARTLVQIVRDAAHKVKNPDYSATVGRRELFEQRRDARKIRRRHYQAPVLTLA